MGNKQSTVVSIHDELERKLQDSDATPMVIPLEFLKTITRDFSSVILGNGGFGVVYKGDLRCGKTIAVKRLNTPHLIAEQFQKEVRSLMGMRKHPNVVRFVGYCDDSRSEVVTMDEMPIVANRLEKLLCFEYVPNKSLDEHISGMATTQAESLSFDWETRFKIIKGICYGLHFLHEECCIVHLDLKPQNILMDSSMRPKITDFGLSRIFGENQTRIITKNCPGTLGYMAREYIDRGVVTKKADIFSLGVIFIEIITGSREYPDFLRGSPSDNSTSLQEFKDKVLGSWRNSILSSLMPRPLEYCMVQVEQCITIALDCVDFIMEKRPTIEDIIKMLNGVDQKIPFSKDDMLGIEPLELHFNFEHNRQISSSFQLTNETDACIAFEIQKMSLLPYSLVPNKGIVLPRSKCNVDITLQPQEKVPQHADKFIVRSTRVTDGFEAENINSDVFEENMGNLVDEVNLDVVFDAQLQRKLLDIRPLKLCFLVEPNKLIPCSLHLTNKKDKQVVFRLMEMEKRYNQECVLKLPLYNIVPPRSTYTLVVTLSTEKMENLPQEREVDLIMQTVLSDVYITSFKTRDDWDQYFEKANRGNAVHMVPLKAIYAPPCKTPGEMSLFK